MRCGLVFSRIKANADGIFNIGLFQRLEEGLSRWFLGEKTGDMKEKVQLSNKEFAFWRKTVFVLAFSAIAALFMLISVPLLVAPDFYRLDFSEAVVLMGGFALGPMAGILIEALKIFLKLLLDGSDTLVLSGLANFIIGCSFIVPATLYYRRNKSWKNAFIACGVGVGSVTLVSLLLNYLVLIPGYAESLGVDIQTIVAMGTETNPAIRNLGEFVFFATLPFNICKAAFSSGIVMVAYWKIAPMFET